MTADELYNHFCESLGELSRQREVLLLLASNKYEEAIALPFVEDIKDGIIWFIDGNILHAKDPGEVLKQVLSQLNELYGTPASAFHDMAEKYNAFCAAKKALLTTDYGEVMNQHLWRLSGVT